MQLAFEASAFYPQCVPNLAKMAKMRLTIAKIRPKMAKMRAKMAKMSHCTPHVAHQLLTPRLIYPNQPCK